MVKYFCDICGKQVRVEKELTTYRIKLSSEGISFFELEKDVCDDCYKKLESVEEEAGNVLKDFYKKKFKI